MVKTKRLRELIYAIKNDAGRNKQPLMTTEQKRLRTLQLKPAHDAGGIV